MGRVLLCGDFNARTSDAIDYIFNDELDDFLPIDDNYEPDIPLNLRKNDDKNFINTSGQLLIDFCKSTGNRITDGRINPENSSSFTCFTSNGNSVVDYVLSKSNDFNLIENLQIGELSQLSDHCPIEFKIKTYSSSYDSRLPLLQSSVRNTNSNKNVIENLKDNYKMKLIWKDNSADLLQLAYNCDDVSAFLRDIEVELDDENILVERTVSSLRPKIIEIAQQNLNSKPVFSENKKKSKSFCAWFDQECKDFKISLKKARKYYENIIRISDYKTSPRVQEARKVYFEERRQYKKFLKHKRSSFLNMEKDKLWALKGDSPNDFWKKLSKGKKQINHDFSNTELFDYFNSLLNRNSTSTNDSAISTSDNIIN